MKILVACEESQAVCKAFRANGHEAYSCDLVECSGGHPEWHIMADVLPLLNGRCTFTTMDGVSHTVAGRWDMIIAHPPCTYLTVTGNRWFDVERYGKAAQERWLERCKAVAFFLQIAFADCPRIAIENPIGVMSTLWRKPEQVIQPYQFGHKMRKATCYWLKNLPPLRPTEIVEPEIYSYVAKNGRIKTDSRWRSELHEEDRAKHRSKTPTGIAAAMADQWGSDAIVAAGTQLQMDF